MSNRKRIENTLIAIIAILVIFFSVYIYMLVYFKNLPTISKYNNVNIYDDNSNVVNNDDNTENKDDINEVIKNNADKSIDKNYTDVGSKEFKWSTKKELIETPVKVWIDNLGIINIYSEISNKTIKINNLKEKAKYIENTYRVQMLSNEKIIVITEDNNLYIVKNYFSEAGELLSEENVIIQKISSNIKEILKIEKNIIPNIGWGGTFTGVYVLKENDELLSINQKRGANNNEFVLGLSYDECNYISKVFGVYGYTSVQITKDNYLRDHSNISTNYITYENKQKVKIRYWFSTTEYFKNYIITDENKIYEIICENTETSKNIRLVLLNNNIIKDVKYISDNVVITYIDNNQEIYVLNKDGNKNFNQEDYTYGF